MDENKFADSNTIDKEKENNENIAKKPDENENNIDSNDSTKKDDSANSNTITEDLTSSCQFISEGFAHTTITYNDYFETEIILEKIVR